MTARVVCISHAIGAAGPEVGRLVAERLGFRFLDEEIVRRAAERGQVDEELVADAEQRRSLVRRFVEGLTWSASATYTPDVAPDELAGKPHRALIVEVIRETAEQGDVVIVSHAASFALEGRAGLLRVLVTAPPEVRARRLAAAVEVTQEQALGLVRESDAARASYLKEFYGLSEELPTDYDVVLNTETLTAADAAEVVVAAAGVSSL